MAAILTRVALRSVDTVVEFGLHIPHVGRAVIHNKRMAKNLLLVLGVLEHLELWCLAPSFISAIAIDNGTVSQSHRYILGTET